MKLIESSFKIEDEINGYEIIKRIEKAGRTCYKSEDLITETSAEAFIKMLLMRGHESVLEHEKITVRIVCERGCSHEIVRHRIGSYSQESTRYCNYSKDKFSGEIALSPMLNGLSDIQIERRMGLYRHIEEVYMKEIEEGISPQQARDNLPTCLKTEIVVTYNLREWRHFFDLRTSKAAHPHLRAITCPLLAEFRARIPIVFDNVGTVEI